MNAWAEPGIPRKQEALLADPHPRPRAPFVLISSLNQNGRRTALSSRFQPQPAPNAPATTATAPKAPLPTAADLVALIQTSLDEDKAEEIVTIDIAGKSSVADALVVASGRSQRHVGALADHLLKKLKDAGVDDVRAEGLTHCDWVLVDAGDVIVHLFRPEVRAFYQIEKIWSGPHATPRA
jgi:ribosome-associated protein